MDPDAQSIAQIAQHLQQHSSHDDSPDSPNGLKRKAGDDGQAQQRARRNRYVSIACNECKRRKIKCNGQTPCQRCGNLNLECVYAPNCCNGFKDSPEYRDMSSHIAMLQDQVNALFEGMNTLRAQLGQGAGMGPPQPPQQPQQQQPPIDPALQSHTYSSGGRSSYTGTAASPEVPTTSMSPRASRRKSSLHGQQSTFRGPTSSDFNFDVAKSSLQTMGITSHVEGDGSGAAGTGTREASPDRTPPRNNAQMLQSWHGDKDPIWKIPYEEAIRLCRIYEDEVGLMYPLLDIEQVLEHTDRLYRFLDAARRTGFFQQGFPGADAIDDEDTNILKLVLAAAMVVEASGRSDLGRRLFECVQPSIDDLLLGNVGVKGIRLLTMAAIYEFLSDNEGTSWRIIGLTARLCIELGLHRRETYDAISNESERGQTMLLFWSIYVLDRRWSFGTGMPFALQDSDIDPQLSKPDDRSPYLSAMIQYSAIGSKVWRTVAATPSSAVGAAINVEEMNYLDYQIIQWHRSIPIHLRFDHPSNAEQVPKPAGPAPTRGAHRLRLLLYLRGNQMRILIYRPVLHSATSIMRHRDQAQTVVDVAKDTVRVLTHINQTSDLYRTQQVLFNAFLTSALAVLFLAVSHTPAVFAENVREEVHMALDLVRGFSKGSFVSKRLWKTIRILKEVGPKLGLAVKDSASSSSAQHPQPASSTGNDMDPSRSAAVAMAGLAGHSVDELALSDGNTPQWAIGSSSSPEGMVNDLTSLFEAAGGYQSMALNGSSSQDHQNGGLTTVSSGFPDGLPVGYAGDEGLANILKELF